MSPSLHGCGPRLRPTAEAHNMWFPAAKSRVIGDPRLLLDAFSRPQRANGSSKWGQHCHAGQQAGFDHEHCGRLRTR